MTECDPLLEDLCPHEGCVECCDECSENDGSALCVQWDGEVMPEDQQRAYWVWHNEVRPAFGLTCPVVEFSGEHGKDCPPT